MNVAFFIVVFSTLCLFQRQADARSAGPPPEACQTMKPGHGSRDSQPLPAPYSIQVILPNDTTCYSPGQAVTVTVAGENGMEFKGFYVQARKLNSTTAYGIFNPAGDTNVTTQTCPPGANNAASHSSSIDKQQATFTWTATADMNFDVEFIATFVKTYETFWVQAARQQISFCLTTTSTTSTTPSTTTSTTSTTMSTTTGTGTAPSTSTQTTVAATTPAISGCHFPSFFNNVGWLYSDVIYYTFGTTIGYHFQASQPPAQFRCDDLDRKGPSMYFTHLYGVSMRQTCCKATVASSRGAMLFSSLFHNATDAQVCIEAFRSKCAADPKMCQSRWFPKVTLPYNRSTSLDGDQTDCPFRDGTYNVTANWPSYTTQMNVTGTEIVFEQVNVTVPGPEKRREEFITADRFMCLGSVSGQVLNPPEPDMRLLLLASQRQQNFIYCARYRRMPDGKGYELIVEVSTNGTDGFRSVGAPCGVRPLDPDNGFIRLRMRDISPKRNVTFPPEDELIFNAVIIGLLAGSSVGALLAGLSLYYSTSPLDITRVAGATGFSPSSDPSPAPARPRLPSAVDDPPRPRPRPPRQPIISTAVRVNTKPTGPNFNYPNYMSDKTDNYIMLNSSIPK